MKTFFISGLLILFSGIWSGSNSQHVSIEGYKYKSIQGFDVYIQNKAIESEPELSNQAVDQIERNLKEILNEFGLSKQVISSLRQTKIFVDLNTQNKGAVYHPNKQWLIENGYIPEKEKSIEISNVKNFLNWSAQNQPYMLFHELAHAYHHRQFGFDHPEVLNTYASAISSDLYGELKYHAGNGNYIQRKAYASVNHKEYFAELSEAYFGLNDFYPFNRNDLKDYDPNGFILIAKIWHPED